MKLIIEPEVYLVGRQVVVESELARFLANHDVSHWKTDTDVPAQKLSEVAGRLCYLSYQKPRPGGNKAYLDNVLQSRHGSIAEHAVWNMVFTGISRSLSHELVRHRIGMSPSQLSQRYVDESIAEYVVPFALRQEIAAAQWLRSANNVDSAGMVSIEEIATSRWAGHTSESLVDFARPGREWLEGIEAAHRTYVSLAAALYEKFEHEPDVTHRRKLARQAARSVLPNATETKVFVTMNARAARHFLELRCSRHADSEIRLLAMKVYTVLLGEAPNLFGDYYQTALSDGTFELTTTNHKV